jgi:adenosine deaminase
MAITGNRPKIPTYLSEEVLTLALAASDPMALQRLPKADMHCHGLLSAPLSAFEAVLGYALPKPPVLFRDFSEFGGYLAVNLFPALRDLPSVHKLLRAGLEQMAQDGVTYAEVSIDLLLPEHLNITPQAVVQLVSDEKEHIAPRLHFAPEIGINRRIPIERLRDSFEVFLESDVFESVDLYDDEQMGDLLDMVDFFRRARDRGLTLKAHAGELCGPERVRETLDILEVDAIQHGIAAAMDPRLLDQLARQGTQLNVALASNISLGIAAGYENHPIHRLLAAGINVALGTDDFAVFGSSLSDEIRRLHRFGMRPFDLAKLRLGPPEGFARSTVAAC